MWVLYELTEAEQHVIDTHTLAGSHLRGRGKPQAFITDVSEPRRIVTNVHKVG